MTRKQSNNQVNGKMSTLLGQKKQVTKSLGKNMYSPDLAPRTVKRLLPSITSRTSFFTTSEVLKDGLPSRLSSIKLPLPSENLLCDVDSALDVTSVKFESEVLSDGFGVQFSNLEDETFFIGKSYVFK
jgi:hypothetical protein